MKDQAKEIALVDVAHMPHEQALAEMHSRTSGLTSDEAEKRLEEYGHNAVRQEPKTHVIVQFLLCFKGPLTILLAAVAAVSYALGQTLNGSIIIAMVVVSGVLNFVQEYKAGEAVRTLMERVRTKVRVVRDGKEADISNTDVVPGDIVKLNAGDLVPADGLVLSANDFFVNQSSLTGEAFPVEKYAENSADPHQHQDAHVQNLVFAGTSVVTGTASMLTIKTGEYTEYGKIAADLSKQDEPNEFTRGVARFSVFIVRMIIVLTLLVFAINMLLKGDIIESLLFAIAIAVGLTPEFLPVIMSIMMARGSVNMAHKGVIVKRLSAIPAFGSIDVLCTDKTGTLTEDRIALIECADINGAHSDEVFRYTYLTSSFQTGITNPLDRAVLEREVETMTLEGYEKVDEIPFDFERKRMSVVVAHGGETMLVTKGAPEEMLRISTHVRVDGATVPLDDALRARAQAMYDAQSNEGFRVLAVAMRRVSGEARMYTKAHEAELELLGFASFLDPPKLGVRAAIDALEAMSIKIKVVTGDNELVTEKICRDADIPILGTMLGSDVRALSDEELGVRVNDVSIFARCIPDDKTRIIRALRSNGHVVGYLGDGINDASPLKEADVGLSVANAVDVAQESADFILTQKDLLTLRDGVLEGRKSFGNTVKYVLMGLSSNFGNMFSMIGASVLLPFLPMLPIQILLNNFLYDFAQVSVSSDHVDKTFMEKPRRWDVGSLKRAMYIFGPASSLFDFLTFGVLWYFSHGVASVFQTGWFIESLATQTLVIYVIRTRYVPFFESSPSKYLLATTLAVTAVGWVIPFTVLGTKLGFTPLPMSLLGVIGLIVIAYLLFTEYIKKWFYR